MKNGLNQKSQTYFYTHVIEDVADENNFDESSRSFKRRTHFGGIFLC